MTNSAFKQDVDTRLAGLVLTEEAREQIRRQAQGTLTRKKSLRLRKSFVAILAACLTLVFGITVAAGAFPGFETFVLNMGGDLPEMLTPVNAEYYETGIRMQVVAAVYDGDVAVVYFTLQDETTQGRIDPSTTIYESDLGDSTFGHAQLVHFDTAARMATYRMEGVHTEAKPGAEIAFEVKSILSGMQKQVYPDVGITLADIQEKNPNPATFMPKAESTAVAYGSSQVEGEKLTALLEQGAMPALQLDGAPLSLPNTDIFTLSNAGLVGDYLHIQQKPQGMETYSTMQPFLTYPGVKPETNLTLGSMSLGSPAIAGDHYQYPYTEYILELPQNISPSDITLGLEAQTYQHFTQGSWAVSFVLDESPLKRIAECDIDMNPWRVTKLLLTPVGLSVYGEGVQTEQSEMLELQITMQDGSLLEIGDSISYTSENEGTFRYKYNFSKPIDPAKVTGVTVNGTAIVFQ